MVLGLLFAHPVYFLRKSFSAVSPVNPGICLDYKNGLRGDAPLKPCQLLNANLVAVQHFVFHVFIFHTHPTDPRSRFMVNIRSA